MNLLFRIVYAAHANGTHHKLALDALRRLKTSDADRWQRLFLKHADVYLEGSKAPDKQFKDFKNHVLHVGDNYWGGAPEKVASWYNLLVRALKNKDWHEAVWCAGIMSHYYTDPIHPFHTAQSKAENKIHRAVEWSISKSYDTIWRQATSLPWPELSLTGPGDDAIKAHVIAGAETSHAYYGDLIAHYNFDLGVVDPPSGLNATCQNMIAKLLVYAAAGHAALLDRAIDEADVSPPDVHLTPETAIAALQIPMKWVTRKLADGEDRRVVQAMYDELQATGDVEATLPADDRAVRELHAREVLARRQTKQSEDRDKRVKSAPYASTTPQQKNAPAPKKDTAGTIPARMPPADRSRETSLKTNQPYQAGATGAVSADPSTSLSKLRSRDDQRKDLGNFVDLANRVSAARLYLTVSDNVEAAPSIGPKTASRLEAIDIYTVQQLLDADPEKTASALNVRHIRPKTIIDWQHQATLVATLPGLRGTHAQLLVGAGLPTVEAIADTDAASAMAAVLKFVGTSEGQRVLRDGTPPDLEKIKTWVDGAKQVLKAA